MGMNAITSDMAGQRRALQSSFLEAESAAAGRLAEVEAVRTAVEDTCHTKLPVPPQAEGTEVIAQKASAFTATCVGHCPVR